jgi:hypothetical protein
MDTVRVNICYRPLRICWAISAGDHAAFRRAVMLSHTMWGGRFNPIVVVDQTEQAKRVVEVFRADLVIPLGDSETLKAFPQLFPHLINPFFHESLFVGADGRQTAAQLLDIHNALNQVHETPEWKGAISKGFRLYEWSDDDALADIFLVQFGRYPDPSQTLIDYRKLMVQATEAVTIQFSKEEPIPSEALDHAAIAYLPRIGMQRHYGIRSNWDYPGFYLGDAGNLDDLIWFWNLRALDMPMVFIDPNHLQRYEQLIPAWLKITNERLVYRQFEHHRKPAIWSRREVFGTSTDAHVAELRRIFKTDSPFTICGADGTLWNGLNLQAPVMILGETAQLGVLTTEGEKPKLSFALGDKPYCSDPWFRPQHLVASLSFIGGLYGDELHTLDPPFVPELNEFYARTMHFEYNKLRVEPERIGLVIDAADTDAFVNALPVAALFERLFALAGFSASPSAGGLITRQLISQMGGLRGAVVFKIPGVRRLLKTFGPRDPFTGTDAINKIGSRDPDDPGANFKDFEDLYIEPREIGTKLHAPDVFTYLVGKGLFRMGSQLTCPHCRLASWIALDILKQRVTCDLCGREYDATRQLVVGRTHYRRSGVLGAERNAQGAVPVTLTLQQLENSLGHGLSASMYTTSLDLKQIADAPQPNCEVDFAWLTGSREPGKTTIILGECKDRGRNGGGDGGTIDATDISKLRKVADAFPQDRFDTFILLAKLCPFTPEEIAAARTLNEPHRYRVIMLTDRELEPWHIFQRTKAESGIELRAGTAEALAMATVALYFKEPAQTAGETPGPTTQS